MSLEDLKIRIKEIPVSDILGRYLEIVQKGHRKSSLCPFHDDSNPSLSIDDAKGMWYCFVDNIGGDAIKFVQLHLNLGFVDALKEICQKLGWNWDEYDRKRKVSPKWEQGYKILTRAALLYRRYACESKCEVFDSFLAERGLSEKTAEECEMGFAPAHSILYRYLKSIPNEKDREAALGLAVELGVVRRDNYKEGEYYDTFKNRIVFPLWNQAGKVVGFTGRATLPAQKGKYINSSDSFLFNKNAVLYGLHDAGSYIRQKDAIIVVEGHMDRIALASHGFRHTVAVMGTALGRAGLQSLSALSKTVYLALDGDEAGLKAGERINAQFLELGIIPKYVDISPCKDPDEFIQKQGSLEFQKRMDEAQSMIDFCYRRELPDKIPELTERKLELLHKLYRLVKPLGKGLAAKEKIAFWSKALGLKSDPESIFQDYELYCGEERRPLARSAPLPPSPSEAGTPSSTGGKSGVLERRLSRGDKILLKEVILCPQMLICEKFRELLDFVQNSEVKLFILGLERKWEEINDGEYERVLLAYLANDEYSLELTTFVGSFLARYRPCQNDNAMLGKMIVQIGRAMKANQIKEKREALRERHRASKTREESDRLLMEFALLDKEAVELRSAKSGV